MSPWGDVLFAQQPASYEMLLSIFGDTLVRPTTPAPNQDLQIVQPSSVTTTTTAPPATTKPKGGKAPSTTGTTTTTAPPPPSFDPTPC